MHARWVAALVVGVAVDVAVPSLLPRPEAQARQQDSQDKPTKWEYRVQWFSVSPQETNSTASASRLTAEMNKLAADGWEFIIANIPGGGSSGNFLLFRRPKK